MLIDDLVKAIFLAVETMNFGVIFLAIVPLNLHRVVVIQFLQALNLSSQVVEARSKFIRALHGYFLHQRLRQNGGREGLISAPNISGTWSVSPVVWVFRLAQLIY